MPFSVMASQDQQKYIVKPTDKRKVVISDIELNIPRSFLTMSSSREVDGDAKALTLAFTYPEIQGGYGNGKNSISLWFEDVREYLSNNNVTFREYLGDQYWEDLLDLDCEGDQYAIEYSDFHQILGRKHYLLKYFGIMSDIEATIKIIASDKKLSQEEINDLRQSREQMNNQTTKRLKEELPPFVTHIYTNDDPKNPDEFLVCDNEPGTFKLCESAFFYKKLFIKIHFYKNLINNYNDIKNHTLQLIKQWEENNENR